MKTNAPRRSASQPPAHTAQPVQMPGRPTVSLDLVQRAKDAPETLSTAEIQALHQQFGNQGIQRLLQRVTDPPGAHKDKPPAFTPYRDLPADEQMAVDKKLAWNERYTYNKEQPIKQEKWIKDREEFYRRLQSIPPLNNQGFYKIFESYLQALRVDNAAAVQYYVNQMLQALESINAFEVSRQLYVNRVSLERGTGEIDAVLSAYASRSKYKGMLWSKIEPYHPIDYVDTWAGISLEGSLGGALFNGLDFGIEYHRSDALKQQWKAVSRQFVSHLCGEVHVLAFGGIKDDSVFTTIEWPKIRDELMPAGQVIRVVIHMVDFDEATGAIGETGEQYIVTSESDLAAVPRFDPARHGALQQKLRDSEVERSKTQEHRYLIPDQYEHIARGLPVRAKFVTLTDNT